MRKSIFTALVAGALSAAPLVAFGQTSTATAPAKPSSTATQPTPSQPAAKSQPATKNESAAKNGSATHSTRGVVKSINDSTLVITRSGKNAGDMTLALNSSTHRDGAIAVGTPVSVRYMHEGKNFVATAITAQKAAATQAKPSASSTSTTTPKK